MINIINCKKKNYQIILNKLLKRREKSNGKTKVIKKIINDIRKNGDKALLKYEKKFSNNFNIVSRKNDFSSEIKFLSSKVKKAIDFSFNRISNFHSRQKVKNIFYKDRFNNRLNYKFVPISSVGIYVPGGTASFPSTVLMSAIPARIAGVKRIVMMNPKINGKHSPAVLYAAKKLGIKEIYSVGGAQAIAALTYGTKKIKKVDKIVGPGNIFVSNAKKKSFWRNWN